MSPGRGWSLGLAVGSWRGVWIRKRVVGIAKEIPEKSHGLTGFGPVVRAGLEGGGKLRRAGPIVKTGV